MLNSQKSVTPNSYTELSAGSCFDGIVNQEDERKMPRNRALLSYVKSYQILRFMIKTFNDYWGSQGFYDKNRIQVWIGIF